MVSPREFFAERGSLGRLEVPQGVAGGRVTCKSPSTRLVCDQHNYLCYIQPISARPYPVLELSMLTHPRGILREPDYGRNKPV
jgi:hypothetical protein